MKDINYDFWSEQELLALEKAESFEEIGKIAIKVLNKLPGEVAQVCGPISTGGHGSRDKNMFVFSKTIHKLLDFGEVLFVQIPLETAIVKVKEFLGDKYDADDLLDGIYKPLFESGKIKKLFFIHGWESSYGSTWERNKAKTQGIEIVDLPKDYVNLD